MKKLLSLLLLCALLAGCTPSQSTEASATPSAKPSDTPAPTPTETAEPTPTPRPTNPPTPKFRILDMHPGEFVWEDYNIPFPKPEANRFEKSGNTIFCYWLDSEEMQSYGTAFINDGWIPTSHNNYSAGFFAFAKDNQMINVATESIPPEIGGHLYSERSRISYIPYDDGPEGPGSVTRAEALTLITAAMEAQPGYISPGEIIEESPPEVILETYIPDLFARANMQLFAALSPQFEETDLDGVGGAFLIGNGKTFRFEGRTANSFVWDVDRDGIYELVCFWMPNNIVREYYVLAYKYGLPPGSETPMPFLAYATYWEHIDGDFGRYLRLDKTRSGAIRVKWVDSVSYTSATILEDIGLLLFEDGEMFPDNMEEHGIIVTDREYIDPFTPPADWLVSASPPPAP